ncbi:2-hydroxy-3-keto-5-methylthiopentenyl-1-phosphate phosphatase [Bacillus salitolerans]|uniref:2-hydroxy-3-keto-5-methylthiopentenyl-1-phosphate phosphatase n=1 Tax=Bacillus salitolerans TaxID=1437434 RepID=A0ABW4LK00_9BACI
MKKPVIFCDFDGTITETDNIIALMKHFAPPEWETIKDEILSQEISIKEGVEKLFSLLPSSLKEELVQFLKNHAEIREGFSRFVAYTKDHNIPLYIVSGGIDFFVYPLLTGLVETNSVYCNGSDFSGDYIKILWPNSCDQYCQNDCGCCKPSLIRKLADNPNHHIIVIGDSITDLEAAKLADTVIARDFLKETLITLNIPHFSFGSFDDVVEVLDSQIEVKV